MAEAEEVTFGVAPGGEGHFVVSGDCACSAIKLYCIAIFILEVLHAHGPSGDEKGRAVAEALRALSLPAKSIRVGWPRTDVN